MAALALCAALGLGPALAAPQGTSRGQPAEAGTAAATGAAGTAASDSVTPGARGTFEDFLAALLAFESGWDRARYEGGEITDDQLDLWARGPVEDFFPHCDSWGCLDEAQWRGMAYRSMNTLGFVGYQFGEALLIDLGYYESDVFYGNGAAENRWQGRWTGKNGATSLAAFMTERVQERAIREAFGYSLAIIEEALSARGETLADHLGSRLAAGGDHGPLTVTMTGVLAAAHLRGPLATVDFLSGGANSADEYGTTIADYMVRFAGYATPATADLLACRLPTRYPSGRCPDPIQASGE